jgi:hypothetical protein
MNSIRAVMPVAMPNSTGREKKIVNSCTWGLGCCRTTSALMLPEARQAEPAVAAIA